MHVVSFFGPTVTSNASGFLVNPAAGAATSSAIAHALVNAPYAPRPRRSIGPLHSPRPSISAVVGEERADVQRPAVAAGRGLQPFAHRLGPRDESLDVGKP